MLMLVLHGHSAQLLRLSMVLRFVLSSCELEVRLLLLLLLLLELLTLLQLLRREADLVLLLHGVLESQSCLLLLHSGFGSGMCAGPSRVVPDLLAVGAERRDHLIGGEGGCCWGWSGGFRSDDRSIGRRRASPGRQSWCGCWGCCCCCCRSFCGSAAVEHLHVLHDRCDRSGDAGDQSLILRLVGAALSCFSDCAFEHRLDHFAHGVWVCHLLLLQPQRGRE